MKKKQPSVTAVPVTEGYLSSLLISNIVFTPRFRIIPSRVHQSHSNSTQRECAFCLARYGRFLGGFFDHGHGRGSAFTVSLPCTRNLRFYTRGSCRGIMCAGVCPANGSCGLAHWIFSVLLIFAVRSFCYRSHR